MNERPTERKRRMRPMLFRLVAILLGLSPFLLLEAGLRISGWRPEVRFSEDPFVEFHSVRPLFVLDEASQQRKIASNRFPLFRPDSFAAKKGENEFRVFVLGGSTVQGRPYEIETSFTTWLELNLKSAAPTRDWDVVNCGGVSYASYRLVPIVEELLEYEPDLLVLYTGHNEFLEDRTYDHVKRLPPSFAQGYLAANNIRSFLFCRQLLGITPATQAADIKKAQVQEEVDALLDYRNGLEDYRRDAPWRRGVIEHFYVNMQRMIRLADDADVDLILVNPACNLQDCPPFKMLDTPGLTDSQREECERLWSLARSPGSQESDQVVGLLQRAVKLNPQHAGLHYHLAEYHLRAGRAALAKEHFIRSRDEDICPLRVLSEMQQIILDLANETKTPVIDMQAQFEQLSEDGIPGDRWFFDHVHPTFAGHQKIAAALMELLVAQGVVEPQEGWESIRDKRYKEHFEKLDVVYFERGKQRLEGLHRWTQGRSRKVRGTGQ